MSKIETFDIETKMTKNVCQIDPILFVIAIFFILLIIYLVNIYNTNI